MSAHTLTESQKKALNEAQALTEAQAMRAQGIVESKFRLNAGSKEFDMVVAAITQAMATNYATTATAARNSSMI